MWKKSLCQTHKPLARVDHEEIAFTGAGPDWSGADGIGDKTVLAQHPHPARCIPGDDQHLVVDRALLVRIMLTIAVAMPSKY